MGSETTEIKLNNSNELTVIMMAGLQGAGKTTTSAKIAGKLKAKGRKPLLVACDVYRPAAIKQLQVNGEKQGVPVFSMGDHQNPVDIAKAAIEHAKNNDLNVVILDTAGRLHVDETMMEELANIQKAIKVDQTIFVVDAMTGQDAVNVAKSFNEQIELDGVILTKMDGDTRGGAALSIRAVTGKPILYVGMGEKLSDLEQFYPDRMASRILGMGDILTLIDKAQSQIDEDKARELNQKIKKATFGYDDLLESLNQVKNMGGITDMLSMLPDLLIGVVVVLVLSASMSTLSSLVLTSSSTLTLDLLKDNIMKKMSEKKQIVTMQVLIVFFIVVSVVIALDPPTFIAQLMGISWGALAGAFLAPFLYGLYWKGVTRAGVWAGFITGVGLTVANMFFGFIKSPINAGAMAMIAGLLIVPFISLITPKLKKSEIEDVFICYDEKVTITKKHSLED